MYLEIEENAVHGIVTGQNAHLLLVYKSLKNRVTHSFGII